MRDPREDGMPWTPWFITGRFAYRQCCGGAYVELARESDLDALIADEQARPTVLLQGEDAPRFIDEIERLEASEELLFDGGLENAIDQEIEAFF